jgi:hypothetical protein
MTTVSDIGNPSSFEQHEAGDHHQTIAGSALPLRWNTFPPSAFRSIDMIISNRSTDVNRLG